MPRFLLSIFALAFVAGCTPEPTDDTGQQQYNYEIELQDIFIPDRLIEVPVLPAGMEVIREIPIHNAGDRDLLIDEISLNYQSDDNWVLDTETVPTVIKPHQMALVEVHYTAVEGVDTFAALDVYSDDPDEAEMTVAFIGHSATSGSDARVSANILDFGFQFTGVEKRRTFEVRNEGDEDLFITSVEMVQSLEQQSFFLTCPGAETIDSCRFESEMLPSVTANPIPGGSAALFEIAFVPLNLQAASAQVKIRTSDPLRPEFTIFVLGNGSSALNCSAPSVTVVNPAEATFYHSWQDMVIQARVFDSEQPPESLYVELFFGDLRIEDEFPGVNGLVTFTVDIDENEPPIPSGLQTLTLKVSDGCPLYGYDVFVAAVNYPLSGSDTDGDGYDPNQGDCDDTDIDTFPQAIEQLDGRDNDCDGTTDEATAAWDDDGDCFCEAAICSGSESTTCPSVDGGDCNDSIADLDADGAADGVAIFPSAVEALNFIDDNCNGITDEGTTFYDDDGDGQTEAVGDCDDENALVFEGALEWCDGADNDCNDAIDDDCRDPNAPPRVIGGVITDRFQVTLGSRVHAQVLVVSPDPSLTYEWSTDMGSFDGQAVGPSVFWVAPPDNDDSDGFVGKFPTIMVRVTDSLGQSTYGFGNVLIVRQITIQYSPTNGVKNDGTQCSAVGTSGVGPLGAALGFVALFRRRRSQG